MTGLVDTGALYADHDTDASRHEEVSDALDAVYDSEFGAADATDYVYDEAVTLTLKRTGSFSAAKRIGRQLRGAGPYPPVCEILHVSNAGFTDSVEVSERYDDQGLSFTDGTAVELCDRHDIESVLSFDDDSNGLVDRIDPTTL
ncbi:VapC toxin family PIN domain ribonuclease [Halorubrum ezzemoulense]|nr:VapC toxin family PIN domain ribonuclease [Halorubrum ezzemoulense]